MNIQHNVSLKPYNTFGIDVNAKRFISIQSIEELKEILEVENEIFILSGGSNLLLTRDIDKLVVHINILGKEISHINNNEVLVTVNAGENWHDFVLWCIDKNFGGLENLSLIPVLLALALFKTLVHTVLR
jgi:UDP-N-acetylmuramate dehydrogenase